MSHYDLKGMVLIFFRYGHAGVTRILLSAKCRAGLQNKVDQRHYCLGQFQHHHHGNHQPKIIFLADIIIINIIITNNNFKNHYGDTALGQFHYHN